MSRSGSPAPIAAARPAKPGERASPWVWARRSWRDWRWLLALGLLVQLPWAWSLSGPTHMDAYYYAGNGRRLAQGLGLTEAVAWQFLDEPAGLPQPGHLYWMPLPTLLAAAGYWLADSFRAAQLPFWLLSGSLPVLAFLISLTLFEQRRLAWLAGLFTMAGGFYAPLWNQPETFAPFAWAAGLALLALAWAGRGWSDPGQPGLGWWLVAGLAAGLAHLTRADGVLLMPAALAVWWLAGRGEAGSSRAGERAARMSGPVRYGALLALGLGYSLVMGGWFLRNWLVIGRPLPTAGAQTIFLTVYDDLFAYGRHFDLATYLAWGWGNILRSKLLALGLAAQTVMAVTGLIFLAPFALIGWLSLTRQPAGRPLIRPLTWYAGLLLAAMTLVFTFPGTRGGLFHSTSALWPWSMALAPAGLAHAIGWIAARRPSWQPDQALGFFGPAFVALAFALSLALVLVRPARDSVAASYGAIGATLPPGATVVVGDPPAFYYHTGRPAISVPNEPPAGLLAAAAHFGASYLILDADHPQPLTELYERPEDWPELTLIGEFAPAVRLYQIRPAEAQTP